MQNKVVRRTGAGRGQLPAAKRQRGGLLHPRRHLRGGGGRGHPGQWGYSQQAGTSIVALLAHTHVTFLCFC